jgi:hypothetical protein
MSVGTVPIILRELSKWTFRLTHFRQNAALNNDFGVGRDPYFAA